MLHEIKPYKDVIPKRKAKYDTGCKTISRIQDLGPKITQFPKRKGNKMKPRKRAPTVTGLSALIEAKTYISFKKI